MTLMSQRCSPEIEQLIHELGEAAALADVRSVTRRVKAELERFSRQGASALPERYRTALGDRYARRLLHRDPAGAYTIVVMSWGPGQSTELHDHAGIWCVECVMQGQIDVTQYELLEQQEDRCRFMERKRVRAAVGDAGCLIPPFEYHVLSNALDTETSVTLHVYGGEMDHCNSYRMGQAGWWQKHSKRLAYDA